MRIPITAASTHNRNVQLYWECGPQLEFWDAEGRPLKTDDPIKAAVERLRSGEILAVKGLGGFHFAVDAMNSASSGTVAPAQAAR